MTLYRISNDKVCIELISDSGVLFGGHKGRGWKNRYPLKFRKIIHAPPFARWAIGKETYHVIRWFKQRGFTVQSKRLAE